MVGEGVVLSGWVWLKSWGEAYVIDLPGFGGSSLPEVKSLDEYTDLVVQFCRYMNIKRVIIMCHSLGARVGIVWASGQEKKMIEKLILVDPAGPKEFSVKRTVLSVLSAIFRFVPEKIRHSVVGPFLDEDYHRTPTLRRLYRVVVAEDLRGRLSQIKCKTWVIWGEKDKIVPISMMDVYKKLLPYPIVRVIWGAGHDPHLSHYLVLKRVLEEAV